MDTPSDSSKQSRVSRRSVLAMAAAFGSSMGFSRSAAAAAAPVLVPLHVPVQTGDIVPLFGTHQAGIITTQQSHTYFAALDLKTVKRSELVALLQRWTEAADRLTRGLPVADVNDPFVPGKNIADSGEAVDLGAKRLSITIGFGPSFFSAKGIDRFGVAKQRPAALVDLPRFNGDQLIAARTGGDISIQACADDPQVAFHAIRQLARLASREADIRWVQSGFLSGSTSSATPRNLMGFKDGTQVPSDVKDTVWVGSEGPRWMHNGSILIARRIRIAIEHWDRMNLGFQEQVIGREKASGAPIGRQHESDALPLAENDKDGNPVIAENAHVRLANASENNGAQILRRGYSYNDGVNFTAERWPPWRQAMEYDAGLFFLSYQRDPRTSFIPMFTKMAQIDMLNQFATHTGSGIFACPGGVARGEYFGQRIFE